MNDMITSNHYAFSDVQNTIIRNELVGSIPLVDFVVAGVNNECET